MPYFVAAWLLTACTSAPSGEGESGSSGSDSESSSTLAPTTDTTAPATTSSETSTGVADSTSSDSTTTGADGSSSTDASSDASSSSSTGVEECPGGPIDEWYGAIPPELATDEPYDHDAGLAAVVALAPARNATVDLSGDPVVVTAAIVANVGYQEMTEFWIADANAHLHVSIPLGEPIVGVEPGAAIDLEVTELTDYFGSLDITAIASANITATDQPVWVQDANEVAPDYASHPAEMFTIWGTLSEELGECGGSYSCYTLTHCTGETGVRINQALEMTVGDVVQIVGPLYDLPGDVRFNVVNFDWIRELP